MKKILIINSNYYKKISYHLVLNAKKTLVNTNFKLSILEVPGAYEIPIAIKRNIKKISFITIIIGRVCHSKSW